MKLGPHKTHLIPIIQSWASYSPLTLCGFSLNVSSSLKLLGVPIFDKLTFGKHIRNIASLIAQKIGFIRKCYKTFGNNDAVLKFFYAFILPYLFSCLVFCIRFAFKTVRSCS